MRRWALGLILVAGGITIYWWRSQPPALHEGPIAPPEQVKPAIVFKGDDLTRQELLAALGQIPGQGFPASYAWAPLESIGRKNLYTLETLLHYHPILVLEMCQAKYANEVSGYTCVFRKRERVKGKLLDPEKIDIHFCEKPFSVHMHFLAGGSASKVVYPDGTNYDNLAARPRFPSILVVSRAINATDVMQSSRFPINNFGIQKGTESTLQSMYKASASGALHVRYEGIFKVAELGGRECYKLVRTPYDPPELEGINEYTLYIDKELMLQTGSVLKDSKGELIAEYWFRDVRINPEFNKKQFTRNAL